MTSFWENKKITAYIALKHHTRFIIPIMNDLAAKGATVEYIVAQAERSQEITAIELNLPYSHIFDFLDDTDTDEIYKNYLLLRDAFAQALLKDSAFSLSPLTVTDKTLFATAQEYIAFENYFKKTKPDICIALHETNRWGKMFAYHSKKNNIPFITFQEGLYSTASAYYNFALTGHAQYSTLNLVWGQKTKEKLAGYEAPEDKIIPTGNTHITDEINRLKQGDVRKQKRKHHGCEKQFVSLLLFSINLIPVEELMPLIDICDKNPALTLYMKFHPATVRLDIDNWIEKIPETKQNAVHFIHGEENIYDLMAISDLCILTEGSTTGLEALAIGKPVVELELNTKITYDFSLAQENAAIKLTPHALATAIEDKTDFASLMNPQGIHTYLESELFESEKSISNVTRILESVAKANSSQTRTPLISNIETHLEWSIILPIIDDPDLMLSILEILSAVSDNESYEVILIRPKKVSASIETLLNSLEGDIQILIQPARPKESEGLTSSLPETMNTAGCKAKGRYLLFCDSGLIPQKGWLPALKKGIADFGNKKIFGGKIISRFNNIIHAGMVVDANNCPTPAYQHLDKDFPHTCKPRSFQMVNHFTAIEKNLFLSAGGFDPDAGKFLFLDLSLTIQHFLSEPDCNIYLPDMELIQIEHKTYVTNQYDAIFFYAKWHGSLWDSEDKLYQQDGVSSLQLNAARMTRALEIANSK